MRIDRIRVCGVIGAAKITRRLEPLHGDNQSEAPRRDACPARRFWRPQQDQLSALASLPKKIREPAPVGQGLMASFTLTRNLFHALQRRVEASQPAPKNPPRISANTAPGEQAAHATSRPKVCRLNPEGPPNRLDNRQRDEHKTAASNPTNLRPFRVRATSRPGSGILIPAHMDIVPDSPSPQQVRRRAQCQHREWRPILAIRRNRGLARGTRKPLPMMGKQAASFVAARQSLCPPTPRHQQKNPAQQA